MTAPNGYSDLLGFLGDVGPPMFDDATLNNVRDSGVRLIHMTSAWPFLDWTATLEMHRQMTAALRDHADIFEVIGSRQDFDRANAGAKIGVILGLQDPACIGAQLDRVDRLFEEGIRVLQVAYQQRGGYGSGFLVDAADNGLTGIGRQLVRRVNARGIILDLAHSAPQTALDCLRESEGPTMVSHTACRRVYDHLRGLSDEVIAEIGRRDDVIVGVLAMTFFLSAADDGLDPMIRHIRHLAERIGVQRVAVGTDAPVGGFTDLPAAEKRFREKTRRMMDPKGEIRSRWPTHIPAVAGDPRGFERIGRALAPFFTEKEIDGILGTNARRFFESSLPQAR